MKKVLLLLMVLGLGVLSPAAVTGLYNTGVDSSGVALISDTPDPHYMLTVPSGLTAYAITRNDAWVDPGDTAMWIGPTPPTSNDSDIEGLYIYKLTFNIATNPANVTINGKWATDNQSEIWLNGNATGFTRDIWGFQAPMGSFTLSEELKYGDNVLEFRVINADGGDTGNPTGLLVTDLGAVVVPAPGAILLGAMGTGLVGWLRRRRSL